MVVVVDVLHDTYLKLTNIDEMVQVEELGYERTKEAFYLGIAQAALWSFTLELKHLFFQVIELRSQISVL